MFSYEVRQILTTTSTRKNRKETLESPTACDMLRMMQMTIRTISCWTVALGILLASPLLADDIRPPTQPLDGPGGAKAAHASVIHHVYGQGATQYWIYEPDSPKPESAPVVIFIHGWSAMNPAIYGAWIDHIVKHGNIVIFPRYQATPLTSPRDFTPNAIASIQDAVKQLQGEPDHVRPQLDHFAAVGHSVGGLLVANVAALAAESGLPQIKAVMSTEPGKTTSGNGQTFVPLADMSRIPASTLLLAVAGDHERAGRKERRAADISRVDRGRAGKQESGRGRVRPARLAGANGQSPRASGPGHRL